MFTVQLAKPAPVEGGSSSEDPLFLTLTEKGETMTEAARRIMLTRPRMPLWPHASVTVIGENLAQEKLSLIADLLMRNRNIRKNSTLVISHDASAQEILETETLLKPYPALAIDKLLQLQENQLGIYQPVTLEEFIEKLARPGVEPAVPQVSIKKIAGKNILILNGTAVFRKDKMVGSLNEIESRGYRWLQPGMHPGGMIIVPSPLNKDHRLSLELLRAQTIIRPEIENESLRIRVEMDAEGNFYDQSGTGNVLTINNIKAIEQLGEAQIEKEMMSAITRAQQLNSDIFGWGQMMEQKYPSVWDQIKSRWHTDYFPYIPIDFKVKFAIRRTYITDQSLQYR